MATLTIVPKQSAGSVTIDQIPDEFKTEFEQAWAALQENPGTELRVDFADEKERLSWLQMARSYGSQRTRVGDETTAEKLSVRATPKRGLPKTVAYVSITLDLPGNGQANSHKPTEAETRKTGARSARK